MGGSGTYKHGVWRKKLLDRSCRKARNRFQESEKWTLIFWLAWKINRPFCMFSVSRLLYYSWLLIYIWPSEATNTSTVCLPCIRFCFEEVEMYVVNFSFIIWYGSLKEAISFSLFNLAVCAHALDAFYRRTCCFVSFFSQFCELPVHISSSGRSTLDLYRWPYTCRF